MNQRTLVLIFCLIACVYGVVVGYDLVKKARAKQTQSGQKSNWEWSNDWNKITPEAPKDEKPKDLPIPEDPQNPSDISVKDYQDAIKKSEEYGMPILLFFEAEWCTWCQKLKKETLTDSDVKIALKNYLVVNIDADKNKDLVKEFEVKYLPYYVITNAQKKNLKADGGFKNAKDFVAWLDNPNLYKQPKKSLPKSEIQPESPKPETPDSESPIQKSPRKKLLNCSPAQVYYTVPENASYIMTEETPIQASYIQAETSNNVYYYVPNTVYYGGFRSGIRSGFRFGGCNIGGCN
jgi:thioredoxin-related protein